MMKTAIILRADSPDFFRQATNINGVLSELQHLGSNCQLWLFFHQDHHPALPRFDFNLDKVELVKLQMPHFSEAVVGPLEELYMRHSPDLILFGDDNLGRELATRMGFRISGSSAVLVEEVEVSSKGVYVRKQAYGNNLTATMKLLNAPYCISLAKKPGRRGENIPADSQALAKFLQNTPQIHTELPWLIDMETSYEDNQSSGLERSEFVIAVGNGVGSRENVEHISKIGTRLGAEIGASRPVVMNGWLAMDKLIGISGKIIAPRLCMTAGISGSGAFMYGIEASKCIVAINLDKSALIYNYADFGVECDLLEFFSELETVVKKEDEL